MQLEKENTMLIYIYIRSVHITHAPPPFMQLVALPAPSEVTVKGTHNHAAYSVLSLFQPTAIIDTHNQPQNVWGITPLLTE